MILVNPNNPTGSCLNSYDLRVVVNQCAARSIPLICDEVFLDYLYDAHSTVGSLASNTQGLTFVLGGLSKLLALPQMKCSWIVVNGPDAMVCEAMARLEVIADTFLSINTPVQNALGRWMKAKDKIQGRVRERICANRMFLQTAAGASGGAMQLLDADGGWSAVVRLRDNVDEDAFVSRLLEDEGVFVHPGYFFDFSEGAHFVVSLLPEKKVFQEGVRRIIRHVKG